jgi:hypothetical protein
LVESLSEDLVVMDELSNPVSVAEEIGVSPFPAPSFLLRSAIELSELDVVALGLDERFASAERRAASRR